jgi:Flp pilus assembly protein TadD
MRSLLVLVVVCLSTCAPASAETFLIIPFFNISKTSNLDWIGESLSETIRETLAAQGLIALSREDREEAYKRLSIKPSAHLTKASVIRVGDFLDAGQVIYGSFELLPADSASRSRGSLRIVAQIVSLRKAHRGPEYTEIGALEDLARLQTHLAWQTVQFVLPDSAPTEEEFHKRRPPVRVDAIESYTRGLLALPADQKLKMFAQAVKIEPKFSQANFQLGRLYWERKNYKSAAEHLQKVTKEDGRYREAFFLLGLCRFRLGDFIGAEQAFRVVAEAVPLNEVWNNLAAAQSRLQSIESLVNFQKALEGDPADPDYHFNVGYVLFKRGEYEQAAERFRAVLDRTPEDAEAVTLLGHALKRTPANTGDSRTGGMERLKEEYEESAYLQLKAVLERKR